MSKAQQTRVQEIEKRSYGGSGSGMFAVWDSDDEPLYSDCFGDERRYFSLEEFTILYPEAVIVDLRELTEAIEAIEAKRSR